MLIFHKDDKRLFYIPLWTFFPLKQNSLVVIFIFLLHNKYLNKYLLHPHIIQKQHSTPIKEVKAKNRETTSQIKQVYHLKPREQGRRGVKTETSRGPWCFAVRLYFLVMPEATPIKFHPLDYTNKDKNIHASVDKEKPTARCQLHTKNYSNKLMLRVGETGFFREKHTQFSYSVPNNQS